MKINRPQQKFDDELAEKDLCRISVADISDNGALIYRERVIKIKDLKIDKIPWWKSKTKKSARK